MKRTVFGMVLVCLFHTTSSWAQYTKTIELKPIHVQGWRYFYDFKRINSAYALQIPLQSLEDEEINRRYKRFTTLQELRNIAYLVPFLYIFTEQAQTSSGETDFLILMGGAIVADLTFTILSHLEMKKATSRYNELILKKNMVGFQWESLPNQRLLGIGFRHRLH